MIAQAYWIRQYLDRNHVSRLEQICVRTIQVERDRVIKHIMIMIVLWYILSQ